MPVGEISQQLGIVASTLSGHLAALRRVGLITAIRQRREIHYSANLDAMGKQTSTPAKALPRGTC